MQHSLFPIAKHIWLIRFYTYKFADFACCFWHTWWEILCAFLRCFDCTLLRHLLLFLFGVGGGTTSSQDLVVLHFIVVSVQFGRESRSFNWLFPLLQKFFLGIVLVDRRFIESKFGASCCGSWSLLVEEFLSGLFFDFWVRFLFLLLFGWHP